MRTEQLVREARTIEKCVEDIKRNSSTSYQWYAVKGKNNCIFEIGGRNKNSLELKLYIPHYDEVGNLITLENGFVHMNYSVEKDGIYFSNLNCPCQIDVLKMAKSKDFRKWKPNVEVHEYSVQVNSYGVIKNIK